MKGSVERVRAVINGEMPDRAPLYELLRNDAVINHFTGETLTVENGQEVTYRAYAPAIDATRNLVRTPNEERTVTLEDGRERRYFRWTIWTEPRSYIDSKTYESAKRKYIDEFDPSSEQQALEEEYQSLASIAEERRKLGEVFFFPVGPCEWITRLYNEVGLEDFCYYMADCPDVIDELIECNTLSSIYWVENLPENHGLEVIFLADDIAFRSGPFFPPKWFADHYFSRLSRVVSAYHKRGIKVMFHSDGNLNPILDELVEAGIDGLNPIEVVAGMDVGDIHRRYPRLFLAGGIDVSQLLPFGTISEIKDTVQRTIDAAEGRIMIGSTTEIHNEVPLEHYLALREAVLDSPYQ